MSEPATAVVALGLLQTVGLAFSGWIHRRSVDHGERLCRAEAQIASHDHNLVSLRSESGDRADRLEMKVDKLGEKLDRLIERGL